MANEELSSLNEEEKLRAENDFIKMKLMLEKGAKFEEFQDEKLSPDVENEFLNYILEYEKQVEASAKVRVFDKIEKPDRFRPVNTINDTEIEKAWDELSDYLIQYSINLAVCSPNVNARELYRFVVEELFEFEIDDMNIPGMMHGFIYDEFHPDPIYESGKIVEEELFPCLLRLAPVGKFFCSFCGSDIQLNGKIYPLAIDIINAFNQFKSFYSQISLQVVKIDRCEMINKVRSRVQGNYKAMALIAGDKMEIDLNGDFSVELEPDEVGYWVIRDLHVGGINF